MKSSYTNNINFGDLLTSITFLQKPQKIVEVGILEGFSLTKFVESTDETTVIEAYDIFEDFNGNHAERKQIEEKFKEFPNVLINKEDYYKVTSLYEQNSVDIFHIDVANNGDVYRYAFEEYMPILKDNGILILEGGSEERDNIEWMNKYNKPKIQPVIKEYQKKGFEITVIGEMPSLTIVKKHTSL